MPKDSALEFQSPLARGVYNYLTQSAEHPHALLLKVEQMPGRDILDINIEPQLAQDRKVSIVANEPIRAAFIAEDRLAPRITTLRDDFPLEQAHTSYDVGPDGLCLCVWEENWADLVSVLTPQQFIERLRDWFARTADGTLHQEGQAPEPLIAASSNTLILPAGDAVAPWHITAYHNHDNVVTLALGNEPPDERIGNQPYSILALEFQPRLHGALRSTPQTFADLDAFVADLGADLRATFVEWLLEKEQLANAANHAVILLVIPQRNIEDGPIDLHSLLAFTPSVSLSTLGEALGETYTEVVDGREQTAKAIGLQKPEQLPPTPIFNWRVVQRLDRKQARAFAATRRFTDANLVAVGAGAIGSNIVMNTTKAGIGSWTIIDNDIVLPHNTVRQSQGNYAVGFAKAHALVVEAGNLLAESSSVDVRADFLYPGDRAAQIMEAASKADAVIDFSASASVLGRIADIEKRGRAASFFFNADGSELVMLAEDAARTIAIDEIEAQYFLACGMDSELAGHFDHARLDAIRYANACQDLTRPLPPWQVQTLAGVASGRLLKLLDEEASAAQFWRLDPHTGRITPHAFVVSPTHRFDDGNIRVSVVTQVVEQMRRLRDGASPNETGGILIGTFDLSRNVLHILRALSAPPDSEQSPSFFVRGAKSLKPQLDDLQRKSAGRLQYVGEWHSHPDKAAARPSHEDQQVFNYLSVNLGPDGAPFAMVICGKKETWIRAAWQDRGLIEHVIGHYNA